MKKLLPFFAALIAAAAPAVQMQAQSLSWATAYNYLYTGSDETAPHIVTDGSGNVYVTTNTETGTWDILTIKYNSSGTQLWSVIYRGPGNGSEWVNDIAVDASGNVYVTGSTYSAGSSYPDFLTVKYNSSGVQQWATTYDAPLNNYDAATALAVDASGNVFVTGESNNGNGSDFLTVKYNASGVQQWTMRYDGIEHLTDQPAAIALDAAGNVYVTGSGYATGYIFDGITIKYSPSGTQLWASIYNGTANSFDNSNDLVLDAAGNVYISGNTFTGASSDFFLLKYDSNGSQQWIQTRTNGGCKEMAIDGSDNIYVTSLRAGATVMTVKYNSSGVFQWEDDLNVNSGWPNGIALDNNNNVYVAGYSYGSGGDYFTVKYNSSGAMQWLNYYNGAANGNDQANDLAVDGYGRIFVAGDSYNGSSTDLVTLKYDASGSLLQTLSYDGQASARDYGETMTTDASGNVYVTGSSYSNLNDNDFMTVKYNSAGVVQWSARYTGPGFHEDHPTDIAADAAGNVYVTGSREINSAHWDVVTIKYNSSGVQQWVQIFNLFGAGEDYGNNLVIDPAQGIYVVGSADTYTTSTDMLILKYDFNGNLLWSRTYDGGFGDIDVAERVELDGAGNLYVAGYVSNGYSDIGLVKYDSNGNLLWATSFNGSFDNNDYTRDIKVDAAGNLFLTGWMFSLADFGDIVTQRYSSSGTLIWTQYYNAGPASWDYAENLVIDNADNVYVTGTQAFASGHSDIVTLKYSSAGAPQWTRVYNGASNTDDYASAIALDNCLNVYVTGNANTTYNSGNIVTLKYSNAGTPLSTTSYTGTAGSFNQAGDMVISNNQLSIGGLTDKKQGAQEDFLALRYKIGRCFILSPIDTFILAEAEASTVMPDSVFRRSQLSPGETIRAYPNPANEYVVLEGNALDEAVTVTWTDMQGRELPAKTTRRSDGSLEADVRFLSPGLYVLKVKYSGGIYTERILVQ